MHKNTGFTLLELSIVLVIIALVVAGIVTGKTLIRQAELRSVLQEYDQYNKAVKEFIDKYSALPGDMSTAATAWGSDGCPNNTYTATIPTSTATCSGDGDGKVNNCTGAMTAAACVTTTVNETWRAWQHLSNAGFIEGRFTGRAGGTFSSTQATPGLNVPASKLRPAGWTFVSYTNVTTAAGMVGDNYGNVFFFGGGKGGNGGKFTTEPVIPVLDTIELDLKIDDGLPTTGMLRAWDDTWMPSTDNGPTAGVHATTPECVNGAAYYIPDGSLSDKFFTCSLIFIPGL